MNIYMYEQLEICTFDITFIWMFSWIFKWTFRWTFIWKSTCFLESCVNHFKFYLYQRIKFFCIFILHQNLTLTIMWAWPSSAPACLLFCDCFDNPFCSHLVHFYSRCLDGVHLCSQSNKFNDGNPFCLILHLARNQIIDIRIKVGMVNIIVTKIKPLLVPLEIFIDICIRGYMIA